MNIKLKHLKEKKYLITAALIFAAVNIFLNTGKFYSQSKYKYVGANTCVGACHKSEIQGNQFEVWNQSAHSKAYLTLKTEKADSIAAQKGFTSPAAETQECIKCHTLGKETDEKVFQASFDITQGVQCESCHGPGSAYSKLSIMKDKEKAKSKGLILHSEKEKFCIECHNPESPTYFEFDYDSMWKMIAHSKPKE